MAVVMIVLVADAVVRMQEDSESKVVNLCMISDA